MESAIEALLAKEEQRLALGKQAREDVQGYTGLHAQQDIARLVKLYEIKIFSIKDFIYILPISIGLATSWLLSDMEPGQSTLALVS